MKFKSALVTSASGSIGGMTASRNRGGMYLRARVMGTNPDTSRQREVRDAVSTLAQQWNEILTPAQRAAWNLYAQQVKLMGALGDEIQVSGINMFVRSNTARLAVGEAPILSGPTAFQLAPLVNIDGTGVTTAGTNNLVVSFTTPGLWNAVNGAFLLVYASRPENPGKVPRGPFRFAGFIEGNSGSPPSSGTLTMPFPADADQNVRVAAKLLLPDGRVSNRSSIDVVVALP